MELLEDRRLMSSVGVEKFRSLDGTGNNLAHPLWGSTGITLLRVAPSAYADGKSAPAGANRPSPREISNAVNASLPEGQLNSRDMSAFVYVWGQFLDHDMDLTESGIPTEPFNVNVPANDTFFDPGGTGSQLIYLNRSTYDPTTGTSTHNPRQQTNSLTAWIDGSVVYGSDPARAAALRTFSDGRLKTSDGDMLPYNTGNLPNANDTHVLPADQLYLAGDVRANENIELTALQTLFMREHNRIAAQIQARNPHLSDESIYQRARQLVSAEIESITYNEFLPALLGDGAIAPYAGYDSSVNPGIANEFSTAAFRLGHSLLGDDVEFLDGNGGDVREPLELQNAFFNPPVVQQAGLDPILKYLASDRTQELDTKIVDGVRNFLFGQPGAGGFDLASLNIQRGRDHGLSDYNTTRAAYGLPRVTRFDQITSDPVLQGKLQELYHSVDDIDLWVGALAEDHVAGGSVGPLVRQILTDQFTRLRDGDRFWYQRVLSRKDLANVQDTQLSDIIRRDTDLENIQDNVFYFHVKVTGNVYNDRNRNGQQNRGESGMSDWTVQLIDDTGAVAATTKTAASGEYTFASVDLGHYHIGITPPSQWVQTSRELDEMVITRGDTTISGIDYGYADNSGWTGGRNHDDSSPSHRRPSHK